MNSLRKKNILVIGIFIVLILSYHLAIKNTFNLHSEFKNLQKEQLVSRQVPKQLAVLKRKDFVYDSILKKMNLNSSSIENDLLRNINTEVKIRNLKLISFNKPHIFIDKKITSTTQSFTLEGDFTNILKLIYKIEQGSRFGKIIHLTFEKKKNYKTNKYHLQATVYLQTSL